MEAPPVRALTDADVCSSGDTAGHVVPSCRNGSLHRNGPRSWLGREPAELPAAARDRRSSRSVDGEHLRIDRALQGNIRQAHSAANIGDVFCFSDSHGQRVSRRLASRLSSSQSFLVVHRELHCVDPTWREISPRMWRRVCYFRSMNHPQRPLRRARGGIEQLPSGSVRVRGVHRPTPCRKAALQRGNLGDHRPTHGPEAGAHRDAIDQAPVPATPQSECAERGRNSLIRGTTLWAHLTDGDPCARSVLWPAPSPVSPPSP